ncbi:hypothetical protein BJX62DRAFT_238298 [Aspergillus germanicus]
MSAAVDLIIHEPAPVLPNEILWQIFEFLIPDYENHKLRLATGIYLRTLHAISITCRHFHHAVQPYLYCTILIEHHAQLYKLHNTIVNAPYLGNHVKHLIFSTNNGPQMVTREFLATLEGRTTLNSQSTGAIGCSGSSIGDPVSVMIDQTCEAIRLSHARDPSPNPSQKTGQSSQQLYQVSL